MRLPSYNSQEAEPASESQSERESAQRQQQAVLEFALGLSKIASAQMFNVLGKLVLPIIALVGGIILWRQVMDAPTQFQLVGLALYGAFVVLPSMFKGVK